jgi:hypothetical protein
LRRASSWFGLLIGAVRGEAARRSTARRFADGVLDYGGRRRGARLRRIHESMSWPAGSLY